MISGYQTRMQGPTPNGGSYSILHWKDRAGRPTHQHQAAQVEVIEYDQKGAEIQRSQAPLESCGWEELSA